MLTGQISAVRGVGVTSLECNNSDAKRKVRHGKSRLEESNMVMLGLSNIE
jgi:hypothetical protein